MANVGGSANINLASDATYAFMTEGAKGKWESAYAFFRSIPHSVSQDALAALDDTQKRHTLGSEKITDRALFSRIVQAVRTRQQVRTEPESLTETKVAHLLSRFLMESPLAKEQLIARVNAFLSHYVEIGEDVDGKRRELCGLLMEVAAKGNAAISPYGLPIWK